MIELSDFCKNYGDVAAASNVSFRCPDNCVTGLLGPNGAGKTTVLKAVCGIHFPASGKVWVNGVSVEENCAQAKRMIGFMSEVSDFDPGLNVAETLLQFYRLRTGSEKSGTEAVLKAAKDFALEEVFLKKTGALSKGFRQRLAFACAMIADPSVLVLDEPVSGLDPVQIVEMRSMIAEFAKTRTVLLSTHLMQEAHALCSHLVIMHQGRVIAEGTEESICAEVGAEDLEDAFVKLASSKVRP
ncbi:MAG: ABC transporter ATP-binding protein [Treponemataceae bacterium]|nr:ABC transporter ATP-binding protein [Treponemataceae bacterium]